MLMLTTYVQSCDSKMFDVRKMWMCLPFFVAPKRLKRFMIRGDEEPGEPKAA
jgi:hypothetical protein